MAPSRRDSLDSRPPSAAFRPRGVTPNRGKNVASPRADNRPFLRRLDGESQRQPSAFPRRRSESQSRRASTTAEIESVNPKNASRSAFVIDVEMRDYHKRPGGPNAEALEPPSFLEATLPDELAASPPGRC